MLWIRASKGSFLLTGAGCNAQTGHNDFPAQKNASSGFFLVYKGDKKGIVLFAKAFVTLRSTQNRLCSGWLKF